jgi:DNA-binding SARP family transcriptional activator
MESSRPLRIRLLGELQLAGGDGRAVVLPASRKTRALLGYLVATGQAHRRERLCDLFWDGPDDPRAELRWSLSKIRPLLDWSTGVRLVADRERVSVELGGAAVDLAVVRSRLGGNVSAAPTDALKEAAVLFGGEFLDGLDLPLCYRYQEWCMAEREAASRLRLSVLAALVERLEDHPADALSYAHSLAMADPLSESGHAAVVRLLSRLGRSKEALAHYERARRVLDIELGAPPSDELEEARRALQSVAGTRPSAQPSVPAADTVHQPAGVPPPDAFFIGREAERAEIDSIVQATVDRRPMGAVLVTGEPGIGKSHMLMRVGERTIAAGGQAFVARAFEAEVARSYGIWIDLLRTIVRTQSREELSPKLSLLLPELGAAGDGPGDRAQLFEAVLDLLRKIASERPTAIMLDDIQWIDEASSSLLHYVARHMDAADGLLIACATRAGEIDDNAAASRVLRSLDRDRRLRTIELASLNAAETAELVRQVVSVLDATRIFVESGGNPLFALELARSYRQGGADGGRTIDAVIAGHLAPLTDHVRETLIWAAAHGRVFTPDDLARVVPLDVAELLMALGELERRGLVRPVGNDAYDFIHDLVRQAAYRTLSQPRRRLAHRHIAHGLNALAGTDAALAADLVHHAALAGEDEMAARGCVLAGEQALRLFANSEAVGFAEQGLRHVERLGHRPAEPELRIALLKIRVLAATGPGLRSLPSLAETITDATNAAEEQGLQAAAATGHYLLSVLHQEAGDVQRAESSTLRAAEAGRAADNTTRARQLANTARCLLELETEIARSRELIDEAGGIAESLGLDLCELHWARGLLKRWDGREEEALSSLSRALALARRDQDRWREYKCLTWLAMLEQEMGRYADMRAHCEELRTVAARLQEDETPFVETLQALATLASAERSGNAVLAKALARLRAVDDKSYLAYALNRAAGLYRQTGCVEEARHCAAEALTIASIMHRRNEIAIAHAMLAPFGAEAPAQGAGRFDPAPCGPDDLSARARSALCGFAEPPPAIPTAAPTPDGQM